MIKRRKAIMFRRGANVLLPLDIATPRRSRPRRRAANRCNEFPPRHTQDRHRHFPSDELS
jgi:hypothetical protein